MIYEKVQEWRKLAGIDHARAKSRAGGGKLSAPTFSDRYFELLGVINQLQGALNDACDIINTQENLKAVGIIDDLEHVVKNMRVENRKL